MKHQPVVITVVSASLRGEEFYRDGVFTRPDLVAQCQAALVMGQFRKEAQAVHPVQEKLTAHTALTHVQGELSI